MRLGDVVDVVTEYWDRDPAKVERFVAGEHIDEDSLRVTRWGLTSDDLVPPTFNRRFRAGDVLFHSRNLRKLAQPDFDGITGEKLFVLRPKVSQGLLPELLVFLLQTEAFSEYVNRMWAGSTNKFLNKTPLLAYEFALQPLEVQRRHILPLRAANELVTSLATLVERQNVLGESLELEAFSLEKMREHPRRPLQQLCSRIGVGIASSVAHAYRDQGVPIIRNTNISPGHISEDDVLYIDPAFDLANRTKRARTAIS